MKRTLIVALIASAIIAGIGVSQASTQTTAYNPKPMVLQPARPIVKKDAVRLYPNPSSDGKVTVMANAGQTLHFYVFDLEGTLLHQLILKDKEKQTIHNLKKGTYVYDAFLNDEGIDHGSIVVR